MNENPKNTVEFLLGEMSNDLKGIKGHLDRLNGKVALHEQFMNQHIGKASVWGIIGGIITSVAFLVLQRIWPK